MASQEPGELHVRKIRRYGWRRSYPDMRDLSFAPHPDVVANLPESFSLRDKCPDVYDQGELGSCTANGIAFAVQFNQIQQSAASFRPVQIFMPSRLFIYYGERVIENTVNTDSGAEIRDGFKVIGTLGAPPESDWPYDISKFDQRPPDQAYADAKLDIAVQYMAVQQDLTSIKSAIYQGCPVVMGFTVYESFESDEVAKTGKMPMPQSDEKVLGGHCVVWIGWNDADKTFETRNSWGSSWGDQGYFWMPQALGIDSNMASDFWCLERVGEQSA